MKNSLAVTRARRRAFICASASTLALALAASPRAHAQVAYDVTFSGGGAVGSAIVTTNGAGPIVGNVADSITGSLTDTTAGPGSTTGLTSFDGPDQVIQAGTQPFTSNGLAFSASNGASYNFNCQGPAGCYTLTTYANNAPGATLTADATVHPSVDTQQPFYDETSTPLQQATVVFEGGTFKPTTGYSVNAPVILSSYNGGGTVDSSNGFVYLQGSVSGPGGLTITSSNGYGVGLTTANSYTGGTTVDAGGALGIQFTISALPGDVLNNGDLQFEQIGDATYGGVISGTGGVQHLLDAGATLILTGDNTSTGTLSNYINETLQIGAGGSSGTWAGNIFNSGTLVFDRSDTVAYGGVISGSGQMTQTGGGTLVLTGASTLSGSTTIDTGSTIQLGDGTAGHDGLLGTSAITDSGTLKFDYSGPVSFANELSGGGDVEIASGTVISTNTGQAVTGTVTIDSGATLQFGDGTTNGQLAGAGGAITDSGTLKFDANGSVTFGGVISGGGGLTVSAGTITLTADDTFTGETVIDSGATLKLGLGGSISESGDPEVDGTFDISAAGDQSVVSLSGSGQVILGSNVLTLTDASDTFSGVISGGAAGGLTIGAGTETLTGTNTYGGATTIDAGATLVLGDGTAGHNGSVAGMIADSGTLKFDLNGAQTVSNFIIGSGNLEVTAGTLVLTDVDTLHGAGSTETIDSGATMQWGDGTTLGFVSAPSIVDDGALVVDLPTGTSITLVQPVISGSGTLTVEAGKLTTEAANTYTGVTTIDGGANLTLSAGGSIAESAGVVDDGTFDISGTTSGASIKSLSGSGSVALGSHTLVLTAAAGTFTGAIAGSGGLTISAGTETLAGSFAYTGATTIDTGARLDLTGAATLASAVVDSGALDVSGATTGASITSLSGDGGVTLGTKTLTLTDAAGTFSGDITGTGGVDVAAGDETLSAANGYSGLTTIESGATLTLEGSGGIASSHVDDDGTLVLVTPGSGTYLAKIAGLSGSGSVTLGAKDTLVLMDADDTFSGVISGPTSSSSLQLRAGTETLSGVNTYQGVTEILSSGTLKLSGAGSIADSDLVYDQGDFDISGTTHGATVQRLGGFGDVNLGSKTLTITQGVLTYSSIFFGTISGSGGLHISGGSQGLVGDDTYTGATLVDSGAALYIANSGSIAASSLVTDNGLFDIEFENGGVSIRDLAGSGSVALGSNTLTITNAAHTFSGVISGSGGLTIGGGTEGLSGVDTYSGATAIDTGATLKLTGGGSIAESAVVTDNGTFDITGSTDINVYITSLAGDGSVLLGDHELNLTAAASTFAGVISGPGYLYIVGGTETLTGVNTYTGGTGIGAGGTLAIAGGGSIASSLLLNDDGTFNISGASGNVSIQALAGTGLVVLGANTLVVTNSPGDQFSGVISGAGGLDITGGTQVLNGVNTYTGQTTIGSGATLKLAGFADFPASIATSSGVLDNGTFDISDQESGSVAIKTLSGSGAVVLGSDILTLTAASGDFSGSISGTGGITVAAGTEILSGTNPFTGGVTIAKGAVLQLGNGGATGSVASSILDDGLLTFDLGAALTYGQVISGSGSVTIAGTGPITFTADNTYTGGTTIDAGATLKLGAGGTSGWVAGDILDNGTLVFDRSDVVTETGVISGSGALTQAGSGTVILDAVDTVSGQTTVAAGVLEVGDAANPGAVLDSHIGGVLVDAGGTLSGHGTINGAVTNNGTVAPGGTIGTLTVASYTQSSSGALNIEVGPAAASQLKVIGAASIAGTLNLNFDAGAYTPQVYTILTAGSLSGTFSTVNRNSAPAGFIEGVAYGANAVYLVGEPMANAEVYAEVSKATLDRAQSFASMVEDSFGPAVCANGSNAPHDDCDGMRAWAQVIGSSDHTNATSSGFAFTNKGAGALGGIDKRWAGGMTLGVAFGYTENNLRINAADTTASGQSYYLAAYGRWQSGPVQFDGQGFWMKTDWPLRRGVQGIGTAASDPNGDSEGFLAQLSAPLGTSGLRPYVRFTYAHFSRDAVTESGVGMLGYDVQGGGADAAVGEAGLIFDPASVSVGQARVFPTLRLGVQQDFSSHVIPVDASLAGVAGTDFTSTYVKGGRTTGVADAAIKARVSQSFDLTADLRGRLGSGQSEGAASVGGVIHF